MITETEDSSPFSETCPKNNCPFHPIKRYELGYDIVACWPSTGGVWVKKLSPVEMQYLGVDRFADTERSTDPAEEDAFCAKLQRLGASWWELTPSWELPTLWCENIDACVKPKIEGSVEIAYPVTGGVCVLRIPQEWRSRSEHPLWYALRNALTMDERCQVILRLGGKGCEGLKACEDLLSEGLERY